MKTKRCATCKYLEVAEREYYDSNNVRRTVIKYYCPLTGSEKKLTDGCDNYNGQRKVN